jgi:hypothetical protein
MSAPGDCPLGRGVDHAKPARRDMERLTDARFGVSHDVHPRAKLAIHSYAVTQRSGDDRVELGFGWSHSLGDEWPEDGERGAPGWQPHRAEQGQVSDPVGRVDRLIHRDPPTHRSGHHVRRRDVEAGERVVEPGAVVTTRLRVPGRVGQLALADVADRVERGGAAVLADGGDDRGTTRKRTLPSDVS